MLCLHSQRGLQSNNHLWECLESTDFLPVDRIRPVSTLSLVLSWSSLPIGNLIRILPLVSTRSFSLRNEGLVCSHWYQDLISKGVTWCMCFTLQVLHSGFKTCFKTALTPFYIMYGFEVTYATRSTVSYTKKNRRLTQRVSAQMSCGCGYRLHLWGWRWNSSNFSILVWEHQWRIWICYRLHLFWITHPGLYWQLQQFSSSENTKTGNSAAALTEAEDEFKFLQDCIIFWK